MARIGFQQGAAGMAHPSINMHPHLQTWFADTFGEPTDVQVQAWQAIYTGKHTLIAAPTGSGKTLAALLPCLDMLVRAKLTHAEKRAVPRKGVRVLYITPLRALNNDIHHHVLQFAEQLDERAAQSGLDWPGIRCAVRTGDTKQSERAAMLRTPPDVLVTTPESLYMLLTSEKGSAMLQTTQQVIVDEIHDLAADKRGAHLSLSLERLAHLCGHPVQRIGVSATQKPLWRVARFLGGWAPRKNIVIGGSSDNAAAEVSGTASDGDSGGSNDNTVGTVSRIENNSGANSSVNAAILPANGADAVHDAHPLGYVPRAVAIIESAMTKAIGVTVTMPDMSQPIATREQAWLPLLDRLGQLMEGSRSVLIFANSRRLCERLCLRLNDHVGYEMSRSHHGSVSRERRLEVEHQLKSGELRCIVATSSLELGIDVGHVDLVVQIDSPLEAAAGIQRIGRAGHGVGETSRGVILSRQKGNLPEIAVLSRQIAARDIEEIRLPHNAMDVLSQQIVAMVAMRDWQLDDLYGLIVGSDGYFDFPEQRLQEMLLVLSGFYPFARPLLTWDREEKTLGKKGGGTAMAAIVGAGTIPQTGNYPVHHLDSRVHLGELDEEFVHESRVGDVFQLGTSSWMIRDIRNDRIYVTEAANRFSEIPFWRLEAGSRAYELGERIGAFLRELAERLGLDEIVGRAAGQTAGKQPVQADQAANDTRQADEAAIAWLAAESSFDRATAEQLITSVRSQHYVSALPTDRRIVIETYRDLTNQTHVIVLNHYGRKLNRAWLMAIERHFEQLLPYRLYGNAKDDGIELVLPEWDASWLRVFSQVLPSNLESLLTEAIANSPFLAIAFRRIAETSLLLSRSFTRTPMWQLRLRSEEFLRGAMPYADKFPYLQEAMRECLRDHLDADRLKHLLQQIVDGQIEIVVRETEHPSPFAAQFLADYVNMRIYEGDGLDETIKLQLMGVSKTLAAQLFGQDATASPVPDEVIAQEQDRMSAPERQLNKADDLLRLLKNRGDLTVDEIRKLAGEEGWMWLETLAQRKEVATMDLTGDGELRWICADEQEVYREFPATSASVSFIVERFARHRLSFTEVELCERYPVLLLGQAKEIVDELLAAGRIRQAPHAAFPEERIWTDSEVASRLIRLSVGHARKQAEPAEPARWCGQIALLQHALQGAQQQGYEGLRAVIGTMQGIFAPLSHWESILFPSRLAAYRKDDLDLLCGSGEVIWIGKKEEGDKEGKVAFFLAESKALYAPFVQMGAGAESKHPALLARLIEGGASFLTRLSREADKPPSELLPDLLDLVWEGRVSNDQFAPLRLSQHPRSKLARTGSGFGRWYWTGTLADEDAGAAEQERGKAAAEWVSHLLHSFGFINKELIQQASPFSWDKLYPVLMRLEELGAVTRGTYIRGVSAMQFTTREAADEIRQPLPMLQRDALTLLCAADPANPYGWLFDWPDSADGAKFARKAGNYLVMQGDRWRYWVENNGRRVYALADQDGERTDLAREDAAPLLKTALYALLRRQKMTRIVVEHLNGVPVLETEAGKQLLVNGAERDQKAIVLWSNG